MITALPGLDDAVPFDLKINFDKGRVVGIEKGDEAPAPTGEIGRRAREAAAEKRRRSRRKKPRRKPADMEGKPQQGTPARRQ